MIDFDGQAAVAEPHTSSLLTDREATSFRDLPAVSITRATASTYPARATRLPALSRRGSTQPGTELLVALTKHWVIQANPRRESEAVEVLWGVRK